MSATTAAAPQVGNPSRVTFSGSIWEAASSSSSESSSEEFSNPMREDQNRFLAYLARIKILTMKAVKANVRYTAYSSDFGEAFRPSIPKWLVNASYGAVGVYIVVDVALEGKNEKDNGGTNFEIGRRVAHASMFQSLASLAIPTIVIHSAVKYSRFGFVKYLPSQLKWGPSIFGLCCIPLLPFADEPVEVVVDGFFEKFIPKKSWTESEEEKKKVD
jgi:fission process protein 1